MPDSKLLMVRDRCLARGATNIPNADNTPACIGTIAFFMPSDSARAQTCKPPAPPKHARVRSAGSRPRCTDMTRNARAIFSLATSIIPWAAASTDKPIGAATEATAFCAAFSFSGILPPRKASPRRRPNTRFASLTVGSIPPLP